MADENTSRLTAVKPKRKYKKRAQTVSDSEQKKRRQYRDKLGKIFLAKVESERWHSLKRKEMSHTAFAKLLMDSYERLAALEAAPNTSEGKPSIMSYESRLLSDPLLDSRAGTRFNDAACTGQIEDEGSDNGNLPSYNSLVASEENLVTRIVNKRVHFGPLSMECSSDSEVESASDEECHSNSEMDAASEKLDGENEPVDIGTDTLPIHIESPSPSDIVCGPGGLETNDSVAKLNGNIDASHLVVGDSVCKVKEEPETGPDYLLYPGFTGSLVMNCCEEDSVNDTTIEDPNSEWVYDSDSVTSNDNDDNRYVDNVAKDPDFNPEECEEFPISKKDKRRGHKRQSTTEKYFTLDDGKKSKCALKYQPYIEVITEPCPFPATLDSSESSVQNVCVEKSTTDVSTECPLKSNPCEDGELCKHLSVDDKVIDKDRIPDIVEGAKPVVKYRCTVCGRVLQHLLNMQQHISQKEIATSDSRVCELDELSSDNEKSTKKTRRLIVKTRKRRRTNCTENTVSSDDDKLNEQFTKVKEVSRKGNSPVYFFLDDGKNSRCLLKFRQYLGVISESLSELSVSSEDPKSGDALTGFENSASDVSFEFLAKTGSTDKEKEVDSKLLVEDEIGASHFESNKVVTKAKKGVKYQCLACGLTSISLFRMKKHITREEIYDPQVCIYCGEVSPSTHALSVHEAKHNDKEVIKKQSYLTCAYDGCFRKVLKEHADVMKQHVSAVHLNERKYVCSWADCEKRFNSPHALEVHMRIHTDSKPIVCYLCGYRCRQKASLNWHMKSKHPQAALPKVLN